MELLLHRGGVCLRQKLWYLNLVAALPYIKLTWMLVGRQVNLPPREKKKREEFCRGGRREEQRKKYRFIGLIILYFSL